MREADERYFETLEAELDSAMRVAERARERGGDPKPEVEIPTARDMADRVENILGIDGVAGRVRELEGEMSREEAALELVEDFVEGTVGDYDTREGKVEGAVRTAVALLTEGVVAAPIEGIDRVELLRNDDGTEFINVYYAGPIRSAGGTAQALSVLVADYARALLGIEQYEARKEEVGRYAEEIDLYDKDTGLQYSPKEKETTFIAEHMPIMLDGEATGDEEVSGYRDLERVDSNAARGGMCLVLAEGIALKAPKIQRYTRNLDEVDWPWLQDLIDGTIGEDSEADQGETSEDASGDAASEDTDDESDERAGPPRVNPEKKYLRDLIAGRPVFSHPSKSGGFRLRYGRARNHGFATAGVHPATMHLVDDFLATGTQIKTERPGKAAGVVPVDSIEGPTVRLANGDVRRIDDVEEARAVGNGVEKILDLGEYLVNYGEFIENNHPLAPASYTVEWWEQDLDAAGADVQAMRDDPGIDLADPSAARALEWAGDYDTPLHPKYTYLWHDVTVEQFGALADAVETGEVAATDGAVMEDGTSVAADGDLVLENTDLVRAALERLLVKHTQDDDWLVVPDWLPLVRTLGFSRSLEREWSLEDISEHARTYGEQEHSDAIGYVDDELGETAGRNAIEAVNEISPFEVRERAPTRIGNRMGRPEKSERRDLSPAVHTLFPIGEAGGSQRDVAAATKHSDSMTETPGRVEVEVARRRCPDCGTEGHEARCPDCDAVAETIYVCPDCETEVEPDESGRAECGRCETMASPTQYTELDLQEIYRDALGNAEERETAFETLKAVKGLTSEAKLPEPMEKGILRAKHDVSAFKDGTVRYDMTDLPVTALRPAELDVEPERLRALGYETDIHGDPLTHPDQLFELKVQDIVLSEGAAEHMLQTAAFVDDLLEQYYGLDRYYEFDDRDDLVGELVFGMAPHTSAATVGRVVGFTSAAVGYAHPYFHAAKRRNCFHPETKLWYEDGERRNHYERIDDFVERYLDPETAETDDFGTHTQELSGDVSVPSVDDDGNVVRRPVEAVSKHPAPDHMVSIETRSGRKLTVTPDHEIHVFDGEGITSKRASELTESDQLIKPANVDSLSPAGATQRFDLLAEFMRTDVVDNRALMVKGLDKEFLYSLFRDTLESEGDGQFYPLQSTTEYLGLSKKGLSNYLYRESIPASVLVDVLETSEAVVERIPDDVTLGMKRDTTEIDRYVELDGSVATLLGYYAAEGFARKQETPKGTIHQTTFSGVEEEAREFFVDTLTSEFGVEPYRENDYKVTVSGRLVRVLFDIVLDCGVHADEKRVPACIFDAPDEVVSAFLGGYISGDGTVDKNVLEIAATTVSHELKEDLLALFTRLGITARVEQTEPVPLSKKFPEHYDEEDESMSAVSYVLRITSVNAVRFDDVIDIHLQRKQQRLERHIQQKTAYGRRVFDGGNGEYLVDSVADIEYVESDTEYTYCLTVSGTRSLVANDMSQKQCDGDEDCVMLLMDGLLNFSKSFLPNRRGGRMDAPLVMSSRIDPSEIDDEAHNIDIMDRYPREFYEATRELTDPAEVEDIMTIAESTLGTDREYTDFRHTHDTTDIAAGPDLSAYKTLGSMEEKMDAQLHLSRKLRAVVESDVAERIIEYHFLPDLIGNLRAFSRQEVRCLDCGEKYRRMPLTGDCRECGGRVNLTVHQGSVNKYIDTAIRVADEFGARDYTKQRLRILETKIESVFENDHNKQSGIADFM
ncbi:DNA polymerase II large subunit [Halobacteriales archaeon QS_6_64_34]|nr:MAG: DNA polymerase II large subunit [Halobacteriales archaeon QS_6_64_34]